jgi:hypothetical protein
MDFMLVFCSVVIGLCALFCAEVIIQLRRVNQFSEFMHGYIGGCSARAQEAIKAGDFEWERFYAMDVELSFDSLTPLSFRRYSRDWPTFLVHKPSV